MRFWYVPAQACALIIATAAFGQTIERPDDPLGNSIRQPVVRVIHSDSPDDTPGSSMWLQAHDPWMAYQRGWSLFQREWTAEDGVFALAAENYGPALTNSCGMCHNSPYQTPGSSANGGASDGFGRNVPHLFGIGLTESLGFQIRDEIMNYADANRNGYIDFPSEAQGKRAIVEASPGVNIDYGEMGDADNDGIPDLNPILIVQFVDKQGRLVDGDLSSSETAGYDIAVGIFGAAISDHQFPSIRRFAEGALRSIDGFRVDDRLGMTDDGNGRDLKDNDGWAATSNAGAPQLIQPHEGVPEAKNDTCPLAHTMSAGEVDLLEWYLLNTPRPAELPLTPDRARGKQLMAEIGCTTCHTEQWRLKGAGEGNYLGDRRFFSVKTSWDSDLQTLIGEVQLLADQTSEKDGTQRWLPKRREAMVDGYYSDLLYHDLGDRVREYHFVRQADRAFAIRKFRTPPLWGVGSTAPYGHDGRSPDLDSMIRRHGGEAEIVMQSYVHLPDGDRRAIISFLNGLVLYNPGKIPADIDGDGRISPRYQRNGIDQGPERFHPELLFNAVARYSDPLGGERESFQLENLEELYGANLDALRDGNRDRIPDLLQRGAESCN